MTPEDKTFHQSTFASFRVHRAVDHVDLIPELDVHSNVAIARREKEVVGAHNGDIRHVGAANMLLADRLAL